ncbi:MAG: hypothetical protein JXR19_09735 [Bacteroidia bacterium]
MSISLMLLISVFVVYTIDRLAVAQSWHAYFYLVLIFGVVQNISRSFLGESSGLMTYYRTLVDHKAFFISKLLYQAFINTLFVIMLFVVMDFFLPHGIVAIGPYLITVYLFTLCNAAIFTFNAAIAASAKNSTLVAGVLSFPLLIPNLMVSLKASAKSLAAEEPWSMLWADWSVLFLLFSICIILGLVLFQFLWQE